MIPMTEEEKIALHHLVNIVITECDDEQLLSHYTGTVRTHEVNCVADGENKEYYHSLIDLYWEEILKRMKQKEK